MRRLTLFIVTAWLFFLALIGTAILIGRQQPLPERIRALHLTDCAPPCWIGIVPGKTKMGEAVQIIFKTFEHSGTMQVQMDLGVIRIGKQQIAIVQLLRKSDSTLIASVTISSSSISDPVEAITIEHLEIHSNLFPSLADLVLLWGIPSCVDARKQLLIYNNEVRQSYMIARISSTDQMVTGAIIDQFWIIHPLQNQCKSELEMETWHGFSDWRYWQHH